MSIIEKGKRVKFHYTLKVNDRLIESSRTGGPLEYVHGKDTIIEGLQKGLEGLSEGDKCNIEVNPEEGYGARNPQAVVEVEKDRVPEQALKLGAPLTAQGESGETMRGIVQDIRPESVLIDFNHPLAGKVLNFEIEVLAVSLDL